GAVFAGGGWSLRYGNGRRVFLRRRRLGLAARCQEAGRNRGADADREQEGERAAMPRRATGASRARGLTGTGEWHELICVRERRSGSLTTENPIRRGGPQRFGICRQPAPRL